MAKNSTLYVCQSCGASHPKWAGKCEACGAWNSLIEEAPPLPTGGKLSARRGGRTIAFVELDGHTEPAPRRMAGIAELDRVFGGGLVPGSAILIGGDPGIGKSTLLIQALAKLGHSGAKVAYISGEE